MIKIDVKKELIGSIGKMNLDVNLQINEGDFVALTGLSGSGKTTLLRILAGLEESTSNINVSGKVWQDDKHFLPVQKRQIGFVFQDYALFSNMSVIENLLFVNKDKELALELLELTELTKLKDRNVTTLSGGQKQRVSLCRALMNKPKLLLMDEPLSALDPAIRTKLQDEILTLHKKFKTTTIMVSHDPSEIYRLSNKVIVMQNGLVIKEGKAKDVLLKTSGSAKFSFEGELLDIVKVDVIYVAIISIGQQLVEVVLSEDEAKILEVGSKVRVSTKAFTPTISL
ncbi:molybdenum ABC transporter ATP-binding protein [Arcobacter sp. CECT 8986]|uniref:ABC transporter ATP-binding protein n=1 Tax=Arcobacter sp. CECT 8986 TaxID=2044507 RepID=UPI001009C09C|nr:ATP-binding cassette domain-containing protein [Arcobacter sp. CECT 8986]RXK00530.1 molybdenum ABC transporter ATP-binding protein [Arcobacter sp. CECT 8986]